MAPGARPPRRRGHGLRLMRKSGGGEQEADTQRQERYRCAPAPRQPEPAGRPGDESGDHRTRQPKSRRARLFAKLFRAGRSRRLHRAQAGGCADRRHFQRRRQNVGGVALGDGEDQIVVPRRVRPGRRKPIGAVGRGLGIDAALRGLDRDRRVGDRLAGRKPVEIDRQFAVTGRRHQFEQFRRRLGARRGGERRRTRRRRPVIVAFVSEGTVEREPPSARWLPAGPRPCKVALSESSHALQPARSRRRSRAPTGRACSGRERSREVWPSRRGQCPIGARRKRGRPRSRPKSGSSAAAPSITAPQPWPGAAAAARAGNWRYPNLGLRRNGQDCRLGRGCASCDAAL